MEDKVNAIAEELAMYQMLNPDLMRVIHRSRRNHPKLYEHINEAYAGLATGEMLAYVPQAGVYCDVTHSGMLALCREVELEQSRRHDSGKPFRIHQIILSNEDERKFAMLYACDDVSIVVEQIRLFFASRGDELKDSDVTVVDDCIQVNRRAPLETNVRLLEEFVLFMADNEMIKKIEGIPRIVGNEMVIDTPSMDDAIEKHHNEDAVECLPSLCTLAVETMQFAQDMNNVHVDVSGDNNTVTTCSSNTSTSIFTRAEQEKLEMAEWYIRDNPPVGHSMANYYKNYVECVKSYNRSRLGQSEFNEFLVKCGYSVPENKRYKRVWCRKT